MFLAHERQSSGVHISPHRQGLFTPSKHLIRVRKIALRNENLLFACANAPSCMAPHVLKMAVAPADRRGFLADVVLYVHVCFRAARARRKRTAGGAKRIDQRTADPERRGLKDELESRGIQYSSKEGTAALRRKLKNGA